MLNYLICYRTTLRAVLCLCCRFYTIGWGGRSICSFAAAKVQQRFGLCKFILHFYRKGTKKRAQACSNHLLCPPVLRQGVTGSFYAVGPASPFLTSRRGRYILSPKGYFILSQILLLLLTGECRPV